MIIIIIAVVFCFFPVPVEQVAVPVGGKAYLPCDTRSPNQDLGVEPAAADSSGFFMVMWFREQKETDLDYDRNYGRRQSSTSSTSGEPIFTWVWFSYTCLCISLCNRDKGLPRAEPVNNELFEQCKQFESTLGIESKTNKQNKSTTQVI